jgi:hypothetical protein
LYLTFELVTKNTFISESSKKELCRGNNSIEISLTKKMAGSSRLVIYSLANESYFSEIPFEVEEPFDNYVI